VTSFIPLAGGLGRQHAGQVAGLAAVIINAVVLVGGWAGLPLLSSWGAGLHPMRPTVALLVAALGLALVHPGKDSRFAFGVGLAVVANAALGLGFILFNVDPGIDPWLAAGTAAEGAGPASFSVAKVVALALGLAGVSLALSRFERHRVATSVLASIAGAISIFAILGYVAGIDTLYGSVSVRSPTLPATVSLLCIAVGVILRFGTMPVMRKSRPLWHLLVMLGSALVAPLLLFGAYAAFRIADAQFAQAGKDLTIEASTLSANVDRQIIGEIERLQALASAPSLRQGDLAEFQREASLALPKSGNVVLVDRDMRQLVNTAVPFGGPLPKTASPETVQAAIATGKPQVTGLFVGAVIKESFFSIVVPVEMGGNNRYALLRSPDQYGLARNFAANELPTGWHAVVSDAADRVIARSEPEDTLIGRELSQLHRPGSGISEFIDAEGRPSLQARAQSELTGWRTSVWAPRALLEAPVRAQWRTLCVMGLLAITLVIPLALWLGQIIARSVGQAASGAIALGEGGPMPLGGTPIAEVDALMAQLREAAARRQAADDLLREREATFRAMFDVSSVGKFEVEPGGGHFLRANDAMCKFLGYTEAELLARSIFDVTGPDDRDSVQESCRRLDAGESAVFDLEGRYIRKDGNVVWARTTVNAIRDEIGRPLRNTAVVLDFTDRKEREEKEHLLMREINHRAKNMLGVVHSIAQQTAAQNPKDFVESFSERIQALSANQDLLVRNQWNGVEIKDLVCAQLAHFADLIGSRITVHGPELRLNPASAQAIGLALHELATNAGKYGALSSDRGHVDVFWAVIGDDFTMRWTERDGPSVVAPKRRGFGTMVMEAMAERSVDGAVHLDYPSAGLTWCLTCRTANALEPVERSSRLERRDQSN
jgi:PAS domain S-box-containing protein